MRGVCGADCELVIWVFDDNPHKPVFSKIRQVATSRQIAMDNAEDSKMFRYLQVGTRRIFVR
jgi:hypothetical protein